MSNTHIRTYKGRDPQFVWSGGVTPHWKRGGDGVCCLDVRYDGDGLLFDTQETALGPRDVTKRTMLHMTYEEVRVLRDFLDAFLKDRTDDEAA